MSYKIKSNLKFRKNKLKNFQKLLNSTKLFLPIHREALNINYKNVYLADEIFDPLSENIKINNDLLISNYTREDLLSIKPGSFILEKLNNDTERTLTQYLNEVIINNTSVFERHSRITFIKDKEVTVKTEFSIEKNNRILFINKNKHLNSLKPYTEYGESDEIFDPLSENIKINNDLLISNYTREDLLSIKPGSFILEKLNNDTERTLTQYLNEVIINNTSVFERHSRITFIKDKEVTVKTEFSIEKNNRILFINKNKHLNSLKPYTEYGECEISTEILACALNNFNSIDSPTARES
ncbi:hypothetical protein Glove_637g4 [Diversispora epigaea]|uniref:Uncharacterized protein n=1 Tax=Diversispora epigaea TaxID=1348612 RepID=A0A397G858_9GLOM|nr:hypothetical protein Glove_637g4 [Diversispora epigaea]